jgi:hypothetical protein
LSPTPTPTSNQASDVHAFLCLSSPTTQFTERVLRLLTEERRAIHRERAKDWKLILNRISVRQQNIEFHFGNGAQEEMWVLELLDSLQFC